MSYAGDVTPQQAWDLLRDRPDAVLVDVRTEQEWQTIGVPDISELSRPVHFGEWVDAQGRSLDAMERQSLTPHSLPEPYRAFLGAPVISAASLAASASRA